MESLLRRVAGPTHRGHGPGSCHGHPRGASEYHYYHCYDHQGVGHGGRTGFLEDTLHESSYVTVTTTDMEKFIACCLTIVLSLTILAGFGTEIYRNHISSISDYQNRELLKETYSRVLGCRLEASRSNFTRELDRICGELPVYVSKVS